MKFKQSPQKPFAFARTPIAILLASCFSTPFAYADTQSTEIALPSISVTGNPLGVSSDELVVPVSV
ncbi:MAG: hypothetical protein PHD12_07005, partial [Methylotenera sp.]|nr:hypothetical protein [Methylotenera sp.]